VPHDGLNYPDNGTREILDSGGYPVAICRTNGRLCGFVSTKNLPTAEEFAEAERALDDRKMTWHTTKDVLAALRETVDQ
jgi:hypothetical protein